MCVCACVCVCVCECVCVCVCVRVCVCVCVSVCVCVCCSYSTSPPIFCKGSIEFLSDYTSIDSPFMMYDAHKNTVAHGE